MLKKIIYCVGILSAILAAEGVNRFGSVVAMIGGSDAVVYNAILFVTIASAGVLFAALLGKIHKGVKWIMFVAMLSSIGLMLLAPLLPVTEQILIGLILATIATGMIAKPKKNKK